jgi:hypothetical protein
MKRWKVEEKYNVTVWTYVYAPTKEEALKKLEDGEGETDFDDRDDQDHDDTDWDTLQECGECTHRMVGKTGKCYICGGDVKHEK